MKKNIIKSIGLLSFVLLVLTSCSNSDSRFSNEPTTGWIEFQGSGLTTITVVTEQLLLPLEINVPIYENGLTVSYEIQPVQGDVDQILTTGNTTFIDPVNDFRQGAVELNFQGVDQLDEIIVFDVVLTAVDELGVSVGVDENSLTTYRISTPCPLDVAAIEGSYSVAEVFTSGLNEGLSLAGAFGLSFQVEISLNPGDPTQTEFVLNTADGFDDFFVPGSVITLDTCGGTVTYPTPLNLGSFSDMAVATATYSEEAPVTFQADGSLGNFGPYQFILTKL